MSKSEWRKKASVAAVAVGTVMYALGVLVLHNELLEHLGMLTFALGLIGQSYDQLSNKEEE